MQHQLELGTLNIQGRGPTHANGVPADASRPGGRLWAKTSWVQARPTAATAKNGCVVADLNNPQKGDIIGTGFLYGCERHRPNSISGSPIYFLVKNPSPTHSCVPVNCIEIHSVCQCHRPNSVSGSLIYLPVKKWYLFLFEFDTTSRCRRCIRISTAVRIGMTMYVCPGSDARSAAVAGTNQEGRVHRRSSSGAL